MPFQTFWSSQGNNNQPVFQSTPGDALANPFGKLEGVVGTDTKALEQDSATLYPPPVADGQVPANFNAAPANLSPGDFAKWHSAFQIQYLQQHPYPTPSPGSLQIGSGQDAGHIILSSDQSKIYVLEGLSKADIAKMSLADQTLVANSDYFKATLSIALDLTSDKLIFVADPGQPPGSIDQAIANIVPVAPMTPDDADTFINELELIKTQLNNSAIFSKTDIQSAINKITGRYDILATYADALVNNVPTPDPQDPNAWHGVMSTDNNQSIQTAYNDMLRAEKAILANQLQSQKDAVSGSLISGKQMDAPSLIADFQLFAKVIDGYVNKFNLDVIQQQNELVKTYAIMQDLIQQTLEAFDPKGDPNKDEYALLGVGGANPPKAPDQPDQPNLGSIYLMNTVAGPNGNGLDGEENAPGMAPTLALTLDHDQTKLQVISMFDTGFGQGAAHPEESRNNIKRPLLDIFGSFYGQVDPNSPFFQTYSLKLYSKDQWNSFATRLSEAVTLLQQNNQIAMNEINSVEQRGNQHFALVNDVISKAANLYQTIGRAVGGG